jgi:hypothetical protein
VGRVHEYYAREAGGFSDITLCSVASNCRHFGPIHEFPGVIIIIVTTVPPTPIVYHSIKII